MKTDPFEVNRIIEHIFCDNNNHKVTGTSPMLTAMESMEIKSFIAQERKRIHEISQRTHEAFMHTHEKAMKLFNPIKPIEMKTLKIETPEGYEIDKENSTFEKIVFKEVKSEYPLSVDNIPNRYWYCEEPTEVDNIFQKHESRLSTKERAKAFLALMQLVELRDAWNEIDGGKEWSFEEYNYIIEFCDGKVGTDFYEGMHKVLHFRKEETRDLFLKTFKDLINQAKELI